MNKRERLENTLAGEAADRAPIALWRRFPGDDQRAADHAQSAILFQRIYDWDMAIVAGSNHVFVADYGVQDAWDGEADGRRTLVKSPIRRTLDWTSLRPLDPARGSLGRFAETLGIVSRALGADVPLLPVIPGPLAQAAALLPTDWIAHARTEPERLHTALNTLTENTIRFLEQLTRLRVPFDGIFYQAAGASYAVLSEAEYALLGLPYDSKIIEALPSRLWLTIVHVPQPLPMLRVFTPFLVPAVNWPDMDGEPDLEAGRRLLDRAVMGGLSAQQHLVEGTPLMVADAVRSAAARLNGRRLIIGAGDAVPITAPLSNLRAARAAVERDGRAGSSNHSGSGDTEKIMPIRYNAPIPEQS